MTQDDVIKLAREAGAYETKDALDESIVLFDLAELERFAALVAAAEREARQAAQMQVYDLQERINRADAEKCAAVLAERARNLAAASEACRSFGKAGAVLMAAIRTRIENDPR